MSFDTIAESPVGVRLLDHLVADGFGVGARPLTDLTEAALYELVTIAAIEVSDEKWQENPGRFWPWEERVSAELAEQLARTVPASAAARWWSGSAFDRPQVWLGRTFAAPTDGINSAGLGGKPPTALWTSSALAGEPSAWWPVMREGADGPPPNGPQSIWRITPHPDARVFEIREPNDWRLLCETFPDESLDGTVAPDWEVVREQFDGVHLTVEGLIRVQGVRIETNRGPALLDNWDAESTAWLRWSVVDLERLGTITSDRSAPERPSRELRRSLRRSRRRDHGSVTDYRS